MALSKRTTNPAERIIVALDVDDLAQASEIAEELEGLGLTFKIGNQLGTYEGWERCIGFAREYEAKIFCDTKFKDIPSTVEKSARAITRLQPDFFNIMADNNQAALEAAVKGVESAQQDFNLSTRPQVWGVTVLTSISEQESREIYGNSPIEKVKQFAGMAAVAGLDGVVCSAQEASVLSEQEETRGLTLATPGIRPEWAASDDQSRVVTPSQAVKNGADYLVIGRAITQPPESVGGPRQAAEKIIEELEGL